MEPEFLVDDMMSYIESTTNVSDDESFEDVEDNIEQVDVDVMEEQAICTEEAEKESNNFMGWDSTLEPVIKDTEDPLGLTITCVESLSSESKYSEIVYQCPQVSKKGKQCPDKDMDVNTLRIHWGTAHNVDGKPFKPIQLNIKDMGYFVCPGEECGFKALNVPTIKRHWGKDHEGFPGFKVIFVEPLQNLTDNVEVEKKIEVDKKHLDVVEVKKQVQVKQKGPAKEKRKRKEDKVQNELGKVEVKRKVDKEQKELKKVEVKQKLDKEQKELEKVELTKQMEKGKEKLNRIAVKKQVEVQQEQMDKEKVKEHNQCVKEDHMEEESLEPEPTKMDIGYGANFDLSQYEDMDFDSDESDSDIYFADGLNYSVI